MKKEYFEQIDSSLQHWYGFLQSIHPFYKHLYSYIDSKNHIVNLVYFNNDGQCIELLTYFSSYHSKVDLVFINYSLLEEKMSENPHNFKVLFDDLREKAMKRIRGIYV